MPLSIGHTTLDCGKFKPHVGCRNFLKKEKRRREKKTRIGKKKK